MTRTLVLTGARVWTGHDDSVLESATIVTSGGRISALLPSTGALPVGVDALPTDAEVVDVRGCTIVPGLLDLHVHLTTSSQRTKPVDNAIYRALTPSPEKLLHGIRNATRSLAAGFTTLRVMGHRDAGEAQLRDFINEGMLPGPRMLLAPWPISMTGGRGDLFWPATIEREPIDTADGVDECRRMVRLQRKRGADFIKVTASGGMLSSGDQPHWPNYTAAELAAIADEAHTYDMRVAAHAHSAEGIKRCLAAGIDTIEHGSFLDDECIEKMLENGTFLVPTLAINQWIIDRGRQSGAAPEGVSKVEHAARRQLTSFRRAVAAGVKVAMGTDSTGTICPFGHHARELELYVASGMSPVQALTTATRVAAEAIGMEGEIGTIQTGKKADLLVLNGDPTVDIDILRRPGGIRTVYREGVDVTDPWPLLTAAMQAEELLF